MKCTLMPGDLVAVRNDHDKWLIAPTLPSDTPVPVLGMVYTVRSVHTKTNAGHDLRGVYLMLEEMGVRSAFLASFFRKVPKPDIRCITERYVRQGEDA